MKFPFETLKPTKQLALACSFAMLSGLPSMAIAEQLTVDVHTVTVQGVGPSIGTITLQDSPAGLVITPKLSNLPPGPHGFHVHENGSCLPGVKEGTPVAAQAAGGHLDPNKSGVHAGPHGKGHLGDLPVFTVNADGTAQGQLIASGISLNAIKGRALMIHEGGDNYSDTPKPLGGGGARIACGVVSASK